MGNDVYSSSLWHGPQAMLTPTIDLLSHTPMQALNIQARQLDCYIPSSITFPHLKYLSVRLQDAQNNCLTSFLARCTNLETFSFQTSGVRPQSPSSLYDLSQTIHSLRPSQKTLRQIRVNHCSWSYIDRSKAFALGGCLASVREDLGNPNFFGVLENIEINCVVLRLKSEPGLARRLVTAA